MCLSIVGAVELSQAQIRLLGALMEKERTTPAEYPLSANALMRAANQSTSRDPIVSYDQGFVEAELATLKDMGLVRYVFSQSNRATKFRHIVDEVLDLTEPEIVVMSLLFLRGDQTAGELRTRSERVHAFPTTESVAAVLDSLGSRPEPLTVRRDRRPGQSGDRYGHRWSQALADTPASQHSPAGSSPSRGGSTVHVEIEALREEVAQLRRQLDVVCRELGLETVDETEAITGASDG